MATPDQLKGRARFSEISRKNIEEEAARDEMKPNDQTTLCTATIRGFIPNLNYRYTAASANPISLFEWDMHDFWHLCITSAKVTDADDAGQDRLVAQILYAKEMGTLSRLKEGKYEEAVTSDGKIWTDLPYMVEDFKVFWIQSMEMTPKHRRNFAAFTARLIAVGVGGTGLVSCAIYLLREALEVHRPLMKSGSGNEVSVAELLPACLPWFRYCSHKLVTLAAKNHDDSPEITAPGELASKAGVENSGLSVARWLFWRSRFKELTRCEDEEVQKEAKIGFGSMVGRGLEIGLQIPGEAEHSARVRTYLREKLASKGTGFKGAVTTEDMSIHSDED